MNKILDKLTIFFLIIICISGCLSCNPKKISKPKTNYDFNIINETTVLLQTTVMSEHLTEEDVSRGTGVIISKRHICLSYKSKTKTYLSYKSKTKNCL